MKQSSQSIIAFSSFLLLQHIIILMKLTVLNRYMVVGVCVDISFIQVRQNDYVFHRVDSLGC
jgi:hypothetical protein